MGTVYRAVDQVLQRTVAIKVLKELTGEEVGKKIRLEAQITARLEHPNIVRLYDFGVDGELYFFVMEEVDGTSFQRRWKKIALPERLTILSQVADALDYAHQKGLVHRDVKPANVLLSSSDLAKLSDFGLSLDITMTQESGIVRGTPHYMSPEQAKGRKIDHRTDIYALGVMVYECATGTPPYQGNLMAIMSQHVNSEPEAPRARNPELSDAFQRYILTLMAKAPDERPGSAHEAAETLRSMVAEGRVFAATASPSASISMPGAELPPVAADSGGSAPGSGGSGSGPGGMGTAMGRPASSGSGKRLSAVGSGSVAPSAAAAVSQVSLRGLSSTARDVFAVCEEDPLALTPDDRYLCGHYLAYLLGGSRRRGFFGRRPLDPLNADRGRLLLAMTYVCMAEDANGAIDRAARLLEERPDVRSAMSPMVVMKYLACRGTPSRRKRFRTLRAKLREASPYAAANLSDDGGVLNPGLMPQQLSDLTRLAPERTEVDDQLVMRWNRVTEVWRDNPHFRDAVLRYATKSAYKDPASIDLWPEVVYPLIERARWQRRSRSGMEALWDAVCGPLHLPDAGLRMDRMMREAVPEGVVSKLDQSLEAFVEDPSLSEEPPVEAAELRAPMHAHISPRSFEDIETDQPTRNLVKLSMADPVRFTMAELRALWQEGIAAQRQRTGPGHRPVPVGPYRLSVVPSIRSRSAGQVVLQGMPNKQIEMLVPSFTGGAGTRLTVAVWPYADNSLAITYLDNMNQQRYVVWDASSNQQHNFEDPADFNHDLFSRGLEVPDQLDRALTKRYQPRNPV